MMRRAWFQLVDDQGRKMTDKSSVWIAEDAMVTDFRVAVKQEMANNLATVDAPDLVVFVNATSFGEKHRMDAADSMIGFGVSHTSLCIVQAPRSPLAAPTAVAVLVPTATTLQLQFHLPPLLPLPDAEKLLRECSDIPNWNVGVVHEVPSMDEFMKPLGGFTANGKLFWREEEKQVASLVLGGWLDPLNEYTNTKTILVGSPGVGKSTMLCLLALYVVLTCKKNVVVYRRLVKADQANCLIYMGHEDDRLVYFAVDGCSKQRAASIYGELTHRMSKSDVWLMLDGFVFEDIGDGLETFKMLATSQQVDLTSQESDHAYCCVHPCWKKSDLVEFAKSICGWTEDVAEERFFYSGGSVREFTRTSVDQIANVIQAATANTEDSAFILSTSGITYSGTNQVDRLRRAFVQDPLKPNHYLNIGHWFQVVDSEFAVLLLLDRLRASTVQRLLEWARDGGAQYASLAGTLLEILIHRLAADGALLLHSSPYDQLPRGQPVTYRAFNFQALKLRTGRAVRSGTAADYTSALEKWRDDESLSYWFPACHDFPNIDSIVKLEETVARADAGGDRIGKEVRVAYLQMTVGSKHSMDAEQLKTLNGIFHRTAKGPPPLYVAVCPNEGNSRELALASRRNVSDAQKQCVVHVAYFDERELAIATDGSPKRIKEESAAEIPRYDAAKNKRRQKNFVVDAEADAPGGDEDDEAE